MPHWPLPTLKPRDSDRGLAASTCNRVRPSVSKASLLGRDVQPRSPGLAPNHSTTSDRVPATPPLPAGWTVVHDRAICVLDACDYPLSETIKKLRSAFPELAGSVITVKMVDKRLRMLDQNPEIDFFRIGLEHCLATDDGTSDGTGLSCTSTNLKTLRGEMRNMGPNSAPSMPSFSTGSTGEDTSSPSISPALRNEASKVCPCDMEACPLTEAD